MSNLDHFMRSFFHANEHRKQQPVQHAVPAKQHIQQMQKVDDYRITGDYITKTTTAKLSGEQYRAWITALAITHIHKQKGAM